MKKTALAFLFFVGAPALLATSAYLLLASTPTSAALPSSLPQVLSATTSQVYSPGYNFIPVFDNQVGTSDARALIIKNYLRRYSSPLEPFAAYLVETADKYDLDYRLLVAIAQQESNLCKRIPENSHNCWGYGIYGDLVTRFDSYPEGIETVAKGLRKNYLDKGLDTPEKIMAKYTPPSIEKGGPWAKGVNQFLLDLE